MGTQSPASPGVGPSRRCPSGNRGAGSAGPDFAASLCRQWRGDGECERQHGARDYD